MAHGAERDPICTLTWNQAARTLLMPSSSCQSPRSGRATGRSSYIAIDATINRTCCNFAPHVYIHLGASCGLCVGVDVEDGCQDDTGLSQCSESVVFCGFSPVLMELFRCTVYFEPAGAGD